MQRVLTFPKPTVLGLPWSLNSVGRESYSSSGNQLSVRSPNHLLWNQRSSSSFLMLYNIPKLLTLPGKPCTPAEKLYLHYFTCNLIISVTPYSLWPKVRIRHGLTGKENALSATELQIYSQYSDRMTADSDLMRYGKEEWPVYKCVTVRCRTPPKFSRRHRPLDIHSGYNSRTKRGVKVSPALCTCLD